MSSLLYLGAGLGISVLRIFWRAAGQSQKEAPLRWVDWPWLTISILFGGVLAPILFMFSLRDTPAATASLLVNFEGVATAILGTWFFNEYIGRRTWCAVLLVTLASILLSLDLNSAWGFSLGALGVIVAYFIWGFDNHVSRHLSLRDPLSLVSFRGVVAGIISLSLALLFGQNLPSWDILLAGLLVGFGSYGISLLLFIFSLRDLGATRTMTYFSAAPFIGAVISFGMFKELPNAFFWTSLPLMFTGAWLLVTERHAHMHQHPEIEHEHRHRHDDLHHNHCHHPELRPSQSHSHRHLHEALTHLHFHTPDLHHRHAHSPAWSDQQVMISRDDSLEKK